MKRNISPYEKKVVKELNNCNQNYEKKEYSVSWIKKRLDDEKLKRKYGEAWGNCPPDIQDYYRAEGYMRAVAQVSRKQMREEAACYHVKDIFLWEILKNLRRVLLIIISFFLLYVIMYYRT